MRKAFNFIPYEDVVTPVRDHVSMTRPDQTLGLREMLMQFAYLDGRKLEEIVNRGFDGDEDDESILGVDAGTLDFAELHDRYIDLVNQLQVDEQSEPVEPETVESGEVTEEQ